MWLILLSALLVGLLSYCLSWWCLLCIPPLLYLSWRNGGRKSILISIFVTSLGVILPLILDLLVFEGDANLIGVVTRSGTNYFVALTVRGLVYVPYRNNARNMFDIVSMEGTVGSLSFQHYEGSFSFKDYLRNLGVVGKYETSRIEVIFDSHLDIRSYKEWCVFLFDGDEKTLCQSMLFFSTPTSLEVTSGVEEMGLLSILFSCGLHVNFILGKMGRWLDFKVGEVWSKVFTLTISLFFLILSGFGFTGSRVFVRQVLMLILIIRKRRIDSFELSCLSLFCVLVIFPRYCLEEAFWYPFLFLICGKLSKPLMKDRKGFGKVMMKSLVSILVTFPLAMNLNGSYSILSIFLMPFFMMIGRYIYVLSIPLYFCPIVGYFAKFPYKIFISIFSFFDKGVLLNIGGYMGLGLVILWFLFFMLISLSKSLSLRRMTYIFSFALMVLSVTPTITSFVPRYEVHFMDVGQGSSTLVRNGNTNVLIDTGGSLYVDLANECLIPYFRKIGVSKLDGVLLTHGDTDHDGALESLRQNFEIGMSTYGRDTEEHFSIGNLDFTNYNHNPAGDDENSTSGVFGFEINEKSFLVMGDVPKKVERQIIRNYPNLNADVLLAGHHGSKTSSDYEFVKSINPSLAVISVGEANRYGHPSEETLSVFSSLGIKVFRTDLSGTLVYRC